MTFFNFLADIDAYIIFQNIFQNGVDNLLRTKHAQF